MLNPVTTVEHTQTDIFEHNLSNSLITEKDLIRYCWTTITNFNQTLYKILPCFEYSPFSVRYCVRAGYMNGESFKCVQLTPRRPAGQDPVKLTLPILRLLSSKAQGRNHF